MAKRIGIISDTHNLLRPEVLEILKGCDCILHAGDVTKESLLDQIRFLGNLYVVQFWQNRNIILPILISCMPSVSIPQEFRT